MFENLSMAPPDPILGLTDAFKKDPNPQKINLGVGVFQDEDGKTATLACVKRAEAKLLSEGTPKTYLPIEGSPEYGKHVRTLLFGADHAFVQNGRAVTVQTPGGTGGLRVAADLLKAKLGAKKVWVSDPTWANHEAIFQAAGLETVRYPYYDAGRQSLAFESMRAALSEVPAGDVVLFHTCCHNPTGIDPSPEEWAALADIAKRQRFTTLFDFAYQGFGDGIDEDAAPVRSFADRGLELLVCSSFSKNFGLYNERVGALTVLTAAPDVGEKILSQLKVTARANYSSPPHHGGAIVNAVLSDPELRASWQNEVNAMRARISSMRTRFVEALTRKGVKQDFSFIARQKGMFSFAGITPDQVDRLREKHAIYAVRSGRINVAGMRAATMDRLTDAIADVLG